MTEQYDAPCAATKWVLEKKIENGGIWGDNQEIHLREGFRHF